MSGQKFRLPEQIVAARAAASLAARAARHIAAH
jgi:hypothetical protein